MLSCPSCAAASSQCALARLQAHFPPHPGHSPRPSQPVFSDSHPAPWGQVVAQLAYSRVAQPGRCDAWVCGPVFRTRAPQATETGRQQKTRTQKITLRRNHSTVQDYHTNQDAPARRTSDARHQPYNETAHALVLPAPSAPPGYLHPHQTPHTCEPPHSEPPAQPSPPCCTAVMRP